ncbi:DUF4340 domain-containing protein [Dehalococcoides mccartyi]|nr:DUF4340 domain-containing protein [Dehalococcoides mccartyi]
MRLLLVLVTVLAYVAIGVTWFITNPTEEIIENQPPFFYTLSPTDIRNISIDTGQDKLSWTLREQVNRWYFDNLNDIPADLFRWGGITQLLGGPRTQRVLSQSIDDIALYGLDDPSAIFEVTLRDGSSVKLLLGNRTPDGENNYARIESFPQLVLVDASWGTVLERLVTEPPYPEWYYTLSGQPREIILFDNNEVLRAYGRNRDLDAWFICDLPLQTDPCEGNQAADNAAVIAALEHFGNPIIGGAVALNLGDDVDYEPYGAVVDSPYIAVRIENLIRETGVTEVTRLTMTIGDLTDDGKFRYAVANETSDIITIEAEWADGVLDLFYGDLLVNNG